MKSNFIFQNSDLYLDLVSLSIEIQKEKDFSKINSGGCGCFAYYLKKRLSKISKIKKIRYVFVSYKDLKRSKYYSKYNNMNIANSFISKGLINIVNEFNWNHILLSFEYNKKTYYVDSKNILNYEEFNKKYQNKRLVGTLSEDSFQKVLSKNSLWNSEYQRKNNIKLRRLIKENITI